MENTGIDMWVLIAREYNEDPIIKTMLPPTWLNARRTTIVVFSLDSKTKEFNSVAIARYAFGDNIPSIWNKEEQPNQWEALKDYIVSKLTLKFKNKDKKLINKWNRDEHRFHINNNPNRFPMLSK